MIRPLRQTRIRIAPTRHAASAPVGSEPGPRDRFSNSRAEDAALAVLGRVARQGEFWECSGVEQKHLGIIEKHLGTADLGEAVDAFVKLFEFEKERTACPTSRANLVYPKLADMARPGEPIGSVVEAYRRLVPFERQRQPLDDWRHALDSLEQINAQMKDGEDRQFLVNLFTRDPNGFSQNLAHRRESDRKAVREMARDPLPKATVDERLDWILVGDHAVEVAD